jgi:hypothetical protein
VSENAQLTFKTNTVYSITRPKYRDKIQDAKYMTTMSLDRRAYRGAPQGYSRVRFEDAEPQTKGKSHWSWDKGAAQRTAALRRWAKKMAEKRVA